jgi:hypothetical protein
MNCFVRCAGENAIVLSWPKPTLHRMPRVRAFSMLAAGDAAPVSIFVKRQ